MKLIIFGGGGHFRSVYDSLNKKLYEEVVILDSDVTKHGKYIRGIQIVGDQNQLDFLIENGFNNAFICIGDNKIRNKYYQICKEKDINMINIIDMTSNISDDVKLGNGIFVGKNSIINCNSVIGNNNVINSGSIVEHDCLLGNNIFVGPGAIIGGGVKVGDNTFVGIGTMIKPYVNIGHDVFLGSGSNVVSDINSNRMAYGNPCKEVKEYE